MIWLAFGFLTLFTMMGFALVGVLVKVVESLDRIAGHLGELTTRMFAEVRRAEDALAKQERQLELARAVRDAINLTTH